MKYVFALYVVMVFMVVVTLTSEFIFNGAYSSIASFVMVGLFLAGTICFANARYYLTNKGANK